MTPEEVKFSKELFDEVDNIIGTLDPKSIKGAINWGDLGCACVERVEYYHGPGGEIEKAWRVVVEEAAPGSYELTGAVHKALNERGFTDIEVQCDW